VALIGSRRGSSGLRGCARTVRPWNCCPSTNSVPAARPNGVYHGDRRARNNLFKLPYCNVYCGSQVRHSPPTCTSDCIDKDGLWSSGTKARSLQFGRIGRFAGKDFATCNDLIRVFSRCRCCGRRRGTRPGQTRDFDPLSCRHQFVANTAVV
jgi:hypothetical protein